MEHFAQTNVFARIRTVFAHLITGCAIEYPKIGNLRYSVNYFSSTYVYLRFLTRCLINTYLKHRKSHMVYWIVVLYSEA